MTMKKIKSYTAGLILLLIPVMAGAQALPFTAAETDAASLRKAGADIVETGSIANAAFRNASAIPFYEGKLDVEAGYTAWSPSNSNIMNVAGAYNINDRFGVAAGFSYGMLPAYDVTDGAGISKGTYKPSDMQINAGVADKVICVTSIHFASWGKEFRFPLEYGNQRPLSASWTVIGSGAFLLSDTSRLRHKLRCNPKPFFSPRSHTFCR